MECGGRIAVKIEKTVFGGDGLARSDSGEVIFVPGLLPGETALVEITAVKKNFLKAKVLKTGETSPERRPPECPAFHRCPGCVYFHTTPEYETELKQQQFRDFLAGAGFDPDCAAEPLLPGEPLGYRNKMVLHVHKDSGECFIGYVGADNQSVTPIGRCPLVTPEINEFFAGQLDDPGFRHSVHHRMKLTWRHTAHDGVKFFRNAPPRNATWLREDTCIGELSVPMGNFFQVNRAGADQLLRLYCDLVKKGSYQCAIDLYCGAGLFSAAAASAGVADIRGAEIEEDSITAARYNLKKRGREDAAFFAGDAEKIFDQLLENAPANTLLTVDPPRGGLSAGLSRKLRSLPQGMTLCYISCHPATWARDAANLRRAGFGLQHAQIINQFCRTAHFEIFSVFRREND
ncbi:MAG: class I SAM-dependent RNA methyltransferase [Lentisphaeria bacterium]|nr:class I SAM-dependent RNA methyltransferase [Lentisphaeria bacterium]